MKIGLVPNWESHLVLEAQAGKQVAFELLADEYRDALRALALRMLRNADDANDAVQETLVKAYRGIGAFQAGRPVLPWLSRICSNCCVDVLRRRRCHPTEPVDRHEFSLVDSSPDVSHVVHGRLIDDAVRRAVERLPERYRSIVEMRHFRHMEVGEIAMQLNKPEGTIKSWLFRARALLRKELQVALG